MKEKKNIDRLFQEQLKDFEALPKAAVWNNIAAALENDKKKRRVVPLWWWYSGVAVVLILGFFAVQTTDKLLISNPKVVTTQENNQPKKDSFSKDKKQIQQPTEESVAVTYSKSKGAQESTPPSSKAISLSNKTTTVLELVSKKKMQSSSHATAAAAHSKNTKTSQPTVQVATTTSLSNKKATTTEARLGSKLQNEEATVVKNSNEQLATLQNKKVNTSANEVHPLLAENQKTTASLKEPTKVTPEKEPNALDAIVQKQTEKNKAVATSSKGKWQIVSSIAPVYLQTNTGGSAIDNQFSNNDKTADTNLSFGLGLHYAVTPKLTIRSGLNKVALDYSTNDVSYSANVVNSGLSSVNYRSDIAFEVQSLAGDNPQTPANSASIQQSESGSINQKMGYFELPMEVSYALLNKKFGLSLIGGVSTLFLNENKISLVSSRSNVTLGEANNLNKIHLSSNFGLGFKYQIVPSLQFHFEPMVKYQWNTFSSNSNDFKPVFLGLYSGVSYQF